MSNAATDTDLRKVTLDSLRFGRNFIHMMLEKTPDDVYFTQAYKDANHAAWVVGHLASTDDYFLKALAGDPGALPESWDGLFGMNSKPQSDAGAYPSRKELEAAMNERRQKLEAWLGSMSDEELMRPIEGDLAQFASTYAQLGASLSFHDGFHAAQVSASRRANGLPPLF